MLSRLRQVRGCPEPELDEEAAERWRAVRAVASTHGAQRGSRGTPRERQAAAAALRYAAPEAG